MLKNLLKQGDWLVKIDIQYAYVTVPFFEGRQKYLRFMWKRSMLEFACLPFCLVSALRVFTKLMKPVIGLLRQRGFRLIIYLDDIRLMAKSQDLVFFEAVSTQNLLESLGFVVKSLQQLEFLGVQNRDLPFICHTKANTSRCPTAICHGIIKVPGPHPSLECKGSTPNVSRVHSRD